MNSKLYFKMRYILKNRIIIVKILYQMKISRKNLKNEFLKKIIKSINEC